MYEGHELMEGHGQVLGEEKRLIKTALTETFFVERYSSDDIGQGNAGVVDGLT